MIEEVATIVCIQQQTITVESQIKSTCSGCQQVDNCGNGQVAKALPSRKMRLTLTTDLAVKKGDQVVLGINEQYLLQTAWQVYLWPLLGLIAFSALGQYLIQLSLFSHEPMAIGLGCVGAYSGYWLAKTRLSSAKRADLMLPKVLRIVPQIIPVIELD